MVKFNRIVQALVCTALLGAYSSALNALTLHYDPVRNLALLECDALAEQGLSEKSSTCFEGLLSDDNVLVRAEAARALGDVKLANRMFREASEDSADPYIKTRWGHLFLSTHQISDAAALFRESLLIAPGNIPARIGLAAAQGREFQGEARQTLYDIVQAEPESLHALVLLAHIELELQRLDDARGLLDAALALAEKQDVSPLEIYALYASLDLLNGITSSSWTETALALNASYGGIYAIPAHFYIITYRYREAVDLYQKAVDIESNLADGHSKLGINLLRTNNVFGARHHLQKAYALDPYNTETVNTLRLLDDMDNMRITHADVIDEKGNTLGRVVARLDRDGADALEPYVLSLSQKAMEVFSKRYDFRLKKPMTVELYHNHDDFAVRTVSTPGVGLLGVTFGYLLAMDSPRARATGDFHWGSTLWHEIAHVFTLEAANHLLPRWFSEGLSVYEEWHTGPLPGRELPLQVLQMLKEDQFLPIADLDSGFVRPTYEGQVQVSYMQAGLICTYIAKRWDHAALVRLLKAFAEGIKTEDAIREHLQIEPSQFDLDFLADTKQKYAYTLANLEQWTRLPRQIAGAINGKDWAMADTLSRKLIEIYPDHVGAGNGYIALAESLREQGRLDDALDTLMRWHDRGGYEPNTLQQLARDLGEQNRVQEAVRVLESINWVTPYFVEEHRLLGQHYLTLNKPDLALREFDALLGSSVDDTSDAWLGKSRAYLMQGLKDKATRSVLLALERAPFYREAQSLLLELNSGDKLERQ